MSTLTCQRRRHLEELLCKLLGKYEIPIDWQLLDQALTHPSFSSTRNYDHLELLGDSVLRLAVSLYLQEQYGDRTVGELSALRSYLVSDESLARIAESYQLDDYILVDINARKDAKAKRSRLADATEALIGVLYLSTHDLSLVRCWLDQHLEQTIAKVKDIPALGNYKLALQELTQAYCKQLPEYRLVAREPFTAEVWFHGQPWGTGTGNSIKAAEQAAAEQALPRLQTYCQNLQPPS
ncbi:MAG: ribonuclease III [Pseudanabaenaceae cyanobacterium]